MDDLYLVNVSSLEVRSNKDESSKVSLKRGTVVQITKSTKQAWVPIVTVSKPIISGYVLKKYLKKV